MSLRVNRLTEKTEMTSTRVFVRESIAHLKQVSHGRASMQEKAIMTLQQRDIVSLVKRQYPTLCGRRLQHHELYDLLIELEEAIGFGSWYLRARECRGSDSVFSL